MADDRRFDPLAVAAAAFPGRHVWYDEGGQLQRTVRVDNELMLRFPRHSYGVGRLEFELDLLGLLRSRVSVDVPEIVEVALDRPIGEAFVAHRLLRGTVLRSTVVDELSGERVDHVAHQIATFLRELHGLTDQATTMGVTALSPREFAHGLAAEVDDAIVGRASADAVARAHRELSALAELPDEPLLLSHTDIGGNIVLDERDDRVGIIDFGTCFITHPALDVASLSVLGDRLAASTAAQYAILADAADLAPAVRGTFRLQDALYGARQQDWAYVAAVLDGYA